MQIEIVSFNDKKFLIPLKIQLLTDCCNRQYSENTGLGWICVILVHIFPTTKAICNYIDGDEIYGIGTVNVKTFWQDSDQLLVLRELGQTNELAT